jgi:hypothetical protein
MFHLRNNVQEEAASFLADPVAKFTKTSSVKNRTERPAGAAQIQRRRIMVLGSVSKVSPDLDDLACEHCGAD